MTHSGIGTDVTAQVIGSHKQPCHGENMFILSSGSFRRLLAQGTQLPATKKTLSLLSLFACVQVTSMHSMVVETVAGMTCSLQGLTVDTMTRTTISTS